MSGHSNSNISSQLQSLEEDISKLCQVPVGSKSNLHNVGYTCLLQKLHEIEHILKGLSKMSYSSHNSNNDTRCSVGVGSDAHDGSRCCPSNINMPGCVPPPPRCNLRLPGDLTAHTKYVLNEICSEFEKTLHRSYDNAAAKLRQSWQESVHGFEGSLEVLREQQKKEMRLFIENILENAQSDTSGSIPDTSFLDTTQVGCPMHGPIINLQVVKAILNAPGVTDAQRHEFIAHLRALSEVLSDMQEQSRLSGSCPSPSGSCGGTSDEMCFP